MSFAPMTSAFVQIFAKLLRASSRKSMAFATVESLSRLSSLDQLKSSEGKLSVLTRTKVAEAPKLGELSGRFSSRLEISGGCEEGGEAVMFSLPGKAVGKFQKRKRTASLFFLGSFGI
jgi:hypothetical protein